MRTGLAAGVAGVAILDLHFPLLPRYHDPGVERLQRRSASGRAPGRSRVATEEELKLALKAIRRKMRHLIVEDEARGGGKFGLGGRKSTITGITPPHEFPLEVWEELVKRGKLKKEPQGLYSLLVDP